MTTADRVIRWTTAGVVVGVAAVASYEHAYALVRAYGEAGWTARLVPLTVGRTCASSMVLLDSARRKVPVPALARWLLGLGIAATLAATVTHGLGHGLICAAVAAWLAVALVGCYELLMMIIRLAQVPGAGKWCAGDLTGWRALIRCRPRPSRHSRPSWRPGVSHRCDPRPAAREAVACPAVPRLPGRARRPTPGGLDSRTSRCHSTDLSGRLTESPGRHRELSA